MKYTEQNEASASCKRDYLESIERLIAERQSAADQKRSTAAYERICALAREVGTEWLDFAVFDGSTNLFTTTRP